MPKPKIESDIAQFGLQNAEKVVAFLKTKNAETLIAEIKKYFAEKKERDEKMALHSLEIEREKQGIIQKELAEKEEGRELFMKYFAVENIPQPPPKDIASPETVDEKQPKKTSALDLALKDLEKTEEMYSNYNENISEAENFIKTLDSKDPLTKLERLEQRIKELKTELNEQASTISKLDGTKDEGKAREMLAEINAKNLQIAALKDMLEVVKGKKNMYDKEGNSTTTFADAYFIVSRDQKLHKDGSNFYLLEANEVFENLKPHEQTARKQEFEDMKQQISSVREVVAHNRGLDLGEKIKALLDIGSQIVALVTEAVTQKSSSPQFTGSGMQTTTASPKVKCEESTLINDKSSSQDSKAGKPPEDSAPTTKIR
ncbi:MAG: hypothetical protein H0T84_12635 [Tatlockia sp.]|nr:hypothetical protein [Tatlockia sp.]